MHIAIEGCSHGELDVIYNSIKELEELHKLKIDLLLCCGDFQSVRNEQDLKCMAVPMKYMKMQDFHRYYSGEKRAPILTIFIGGNHEASSYLQELPYGGWVAPNIYYLGYAGVVKVGNLRIGGLSGIYKGPDYLKGHYEKPPYTNDSIRSVYHVRNFEVFRLKQLSGHMDIFMSHDWPRGIYHHGNVRSLIRCKRHFEAEIKANTLGSRAAEDLIKKIRPNYWFSGHLHVKFPAILKHEDEISGKPNATKFLALDKCLPRRQFMQVLNIADARPSSEPLTLEHDPEWLTILRLTDHLISTEQKIVYMPGPGGGERHEFTPSPEEIEETINAMGGNLTIEASSFAMTACCYSQAHPTPKMNQVKMPEPILNPQTKNLCEKLQIRDPIELLLGHPLAPNANMPLSALNKSEMNITMNTSKLSYNPDEVSISDDDDLTSGDIVFEMRESDVSSNVFRSDLLQQVSPIALRDRESLRRSSSTPHTSPLSSSPRTGSDETPRKSLSLPIPSATLFSPDLAKPSRTLSTESSSPGSVHPLATTDTSSAHSGNESLEESSGGSPPRKRSSDGIDESVSVSEISISSPQPASTSKKIKRRNASIYSSTEEEFL